VTSRYFMTPRYS